MKSFFFACSALVNEDVLFPEEGIKTLIRTKLSYGKVTLKSYVRYITAVTNNTRPTAFKRGGYSYVLVNVNQRKAVKIILDSDSILSKRD